MLLSCGLPDSLEEVVFHALRIDARGIGMVEAVGEGGGVVYEGAVEAVGGGIGGIIGGIGLIGKGG